MVFKCHDKYYVAATKKDLFLLCVLVIFQFRILIKGIFVLKELYRELITIYKSTSFKVLNDFKNVELLPKKCSPQIN